MNPGTVKAGFLDTQQFLNEIHTLLTAAVTHIALAKARPGRGHQTIARDALRTTATLLNQTADHPCLADPIQAELPFDPATGDAR